MDNAFYMAFEQIKDVFSKMERIASARSVKLLLLTGDSEGKMDFVRGCLAGQNYTEVKLGAVLSPRLVHVDRDMVGCEVQDFLRDLSASTPLFLNEIDLLFDVGMDVNVLSVLQYAARSRFLVVNWPGQLDDSSGMIYYARGDVQEKSYQLDSEVLVLDEFGAVYPEAI